MIYLLHEDAAECAKMLDDKALGLQIKEIAQTLCNAQHRLLNKPDNIPLAPKNIHKDDYSLLANVCRANYLRLVEMALAACSEYIYRFNEPCDHANIKDIEQGAVCDRCTKHKLQPVIEWCKQNVPDLPIHHFNIRNTPIEEAINIPFTREEIINGKTTPFPLCVPEKYKHNTIACSCDNYHSCNIDTIESYLNYYRTKIERLICPKCKTGMSNDGCSKNGITWTRRERPNI
jgi:hypothetical protein